MKRLRVIASFSERIHFDKSRNQSITQQTIFVLHAGNSEL